MQISSLTSARYVGYGHFVSALGPSALDGRENINSDIQDLINCYLSSQWRSQVGGPAGARPRLAAAEVQVMHLGRDSATSVFQPCGPR